MKTLYLDLFSGISGDMFIGALLDLELDFDHLNAELAKLDAGTYHVHASRGERAHVAGTKFDVHLEEHHHHHDDDEHTHDHPHTHGRNYTEIRQLINSSSLSPWVKEKSIAVFHRVAVAEGKIHGMPPDEVHFHEVGAVDSIVDIVGACIGLEFFNKPRVLASQPIEGSGWIQCAHGRFPIPAPATLEIFAGRNVTLSQCDEKNELITPTGAALLAEFVAEFGPMRNLTVKKIGFGLGTRDNPNRPNVLRAILGDSSAIGSHDWETDNIAVLETNLDDVSAEVLGQFLEIALAAGAMDVSYLPCQMKKNRPGVLLTVLCASADADKFSELILRHTTAFGVRRHLAERRKLRREFQTVKTPHGDVKMKLGKLNGEFIQAAPEYESCRAIAQTKNLPVRQVYEAAIAAWNLSQKKA